jgi:hypothetical protein
MIFIRRLPCRTLVTQRTFSTAPALKMSTDKSDAQKNITKWASTDGHFRRQVSSFRDVIEKGGKYAPEKGGIHSTVKAEFGGLTAGTGCG